MRNQTGATWRNVTPAGLVPEVATHLTCLYTHESDMRLAVRRHPHARHHHITDARTVARRRLEGSAILSADRVQQRCVRAHPFPLTSAHSRQMFRYIWRYDVNADQWSEIPYPIEDKLGLFPLGQVWPDLQRRTLPEFLRSIRAACTTASRRIPATPTSWSWAATPHSTGPSVRASSVRVSALSARPGLLALSTSKTDALCAAWNGTGWTYLSRNNVTTQVAHSDSRHMVFDPTGTYLYYTCDGGMFRARWQEPLSNLSWCLPLPGCDPSQLTAIAGATLAATFLSPRSSMPHTIPSAACRLVAHRTTARRMC